VVAELSARIFDDFSEKKILLAGSGEVGKSAALALSARGAKHITVSSRTWEKAHSLSTEVGGSAIGFERIQNELHNFDIAIFALSNAPEIIDFKTARKVSDLRGTTPLFIVDLSVPQNIAPKAGNLDNIFLYDLADLSRQANENIELRKGEIDRAKLEISKRAAYLWDRLKKS
jgi:glutamyl-tRNA reductase